jgi:hypothetical protein
MAAKKITLLVGERVHLKANPQEGWPRQVARMLEDTTIVEDTDLARTMTCVMVKPENGHDDGIREVPLNQIEEVRF